MFTWFNNLKIQNKLIGAFLAVILIGTISLGWNIFSMRRMDAEAQDIVRESEELTALEEIQVDLLEQELAEKDYLLTGDAAYMEIHQAFEKLTDEQLQRALSLEIDEANQEAIRTLMTEKDEYEKTYDKVVALYDEGKVEEAIRFSREVSDAQVQQVHEEVEELIAKGQHLIKEEAHQADQQAQTATVISVISLVLSLAFGLGVGIFMARSISNPMALIVQGSDLLSAGDTELTELNQAEVDKLTARQDEMGSVGRAFSTLTIYLQAMAEAANRLAQGDLTINIVPQSEKDALGNAFYQMLLNLRSLIGQVQQSANQVASSSQQLNTAAEQAGQAGQQVAATIQQVAQGTAQQTQSVTETTDNVEQMARAAEGIARGAQEQAQSVQNTSDLINDMAGIVNQVGQATNSVAETNTRVTEAARHGVTAVAQTSQGMETIRSRTASAAKKVKEMGSRSKEIGRIVDTIDEIADKTDMLALNAAVEAARAGEHGRGFAVVADQVRKLSEDSKGATRDITGLIERVQETVSEAIAAMDSTVAEVNNGTRLAGETTQSLQDILQVAEEAANLAERISEAVAQLKQKSEGVVTAVESVSTVVEENTAVAEEMAANSQEVTDAMEGVASIAEENSASAEEVSASAEEMSAQVEEVVASAEELSALAEELREAAAQFRLEKTGWIKPEQPARSPEMASVPVSPQPPQTRPVLVGNGQDTDQN